MWDKNQAKSLAKKARSRAGDGWGLLSPAIREALVEHEVMSLLTSQCEDTRFSAADVQVLVNMSMEAAGVDTSDIHH